eukprot:TRINITY_DN3693_c0_g1_i1.p1 TRINITY_DN3693_c0_g1~~TRINITY_DN3693_c0_g1_i1.p1  ORF type:complete len:387 (+),score=32.25 TRINITY_DN3693_c0_g1_i1:341-1501(+)
MAIFVRGFRVPVLFHRYHSSPFYNFLSPSPSSSSTANANGDFKGSLLFNYIRGELELSHSEIVTLARSSPQMLRRRSIETTRHVLMFLRESGYSVEQIKMIILKDPHILIKKTDDVKAKFDLFRSLGFGESELVSFVTRFPYFLKYSLDQNLLPKISYFEIIFGGKGNVRMILQRFSPLLIVNLERDIRSKVNLLSKWGIEGKLLIALVKENYRILGYSMEALQSYIEFVTSMGIEGSSRLFVNAVGSVSKVGLLKGIEDRFRVLESFGLSKEDIAKAFRKYPRAFHYSTNKLQKAMEFFVQVCGFPPNIVVDDPYLLAYNLKRRIKPRYAVYRYLNKRDPDFYNLRQFGYMMRPTDEQFLYYHVIQSHYANELIDVMEKSLDGEV